MMKKTRCLSADKINTEPQDSLPLIGFPIREGGAKDWWGCACVVGELWQRLAMRELDADQREQDPGPGQ